jgi:hypothetical protein
MAPSTRFDNLLEETLRKKKFMSLIDKNCCL